MTPHGCLRTPSCGSCESCRACLYAVPGQLRTSLRRYRRCKFLQLHVNGHRGPRASRARGLPRWSKWEGRTTPEQYWKGTYTRGAGWHGPRPVALFFFLIYFLIFIYLVAPGLSCVMQVFSCSMWDLVPWPGIELWSPCIVITESASGPPRKSLFFFFFLRSVALRISVQIHSNTVAGSVFLLHDMRSKVFPCGTSGKIPAWQYKKCLRDMNLILGLIRFPGGGHSNPFQYCLENPMDRGAWRTIVHSVTRSQTWLNNLAHTHTHRK